MPPAGRGDQQDVAGVADLTHAERYDYQPDIITTATGLASAFVPMEAMIASDRVHEPFVFEEIGPVLERALAEA